MTACPNARASRLGRWCRKGSVDTIRRTWPRRRISPASLRTESFSPFKRKRYRPPSSTPGSPLSLAASAFRAWPGSAAVAASAPPNLAAAAPLELATLNLAQAAGPNLIALAASGSELQIAALDYRGQPANGVHLAVAHDPQGNVNDIYSNWGAGAIAMMRALIRFERWDDLLNEKTFEWKDSTQHKAFKAYTQTIAYLAKGDREMQHHTGVAVAVCHASLATVAYQVCRIELPNRTQLLPPVLAPPQIVIPVQIEILVAAKTCKALGFAAQPALHVGD